MKNIRVSQMAAIMGVHANTLRKWEKKGLLKVCRDASGQRRYLLKDAILIMQNKHLLESRFEEISKHLSIYLNSKRAFYVLNAWIFWNDLEKTLIAKFKGEK